MRSLIVMALVVLGCGEVASRPDAVQLDDGPRCTDTMSINSCGATCAMCTATGARQKPTCDGTSCGIGCVDDAPKCSDNSCSRIIFNFDDGTLQGITPVAPANLALTVRNHLGNQALAIDITSIPAGVNYVFRLPICISGTEDFSAKRLTASVFFDGTVGNQEDYFIQGAAPDFAVTDHILNPTVAIGHNVAKTFSAPLNSSSAGNAVTEVQLRTGTLGGPFSGTIWFDDIKIQ